MRTKMSRYLFVILMLSIVMVSSEAKAEVLAMINYESKPDNNVRKEAIAIMDVDPDSENFGEILMEIPLPHNLTNHHIFYNKDKSKAYLTSLNAPVLHVMDLTRFPYRMRPLDIPECVGGEDIAFSGDGKRWYLTCIGSSNVIMGDAETDKPIKIISETAMLIGSTFIKNPHGITINDDIDRILVTNTVRPSDLGDPGETITVIEASSGEVLSTHKVSNKESPSGEAPVEVIFLPGSKPPIAYITNMYGSTLWAAVWMPAKKKFAFKQVFDFNPVGIGIPVEIYFSEDGDTLYVSTAKPGHLNVFDISEDRLNPRPVVSIKTAPGSHHVAILPNERYALVQNNLLGLKGLSDGSITVVDLEKNEVVGSINKFKDRGFNPNAIILLPKWYHDKAH